MTFSLQRMSAGEFADFQSSQGEHVINNGGLYWRRVHPLFYRPLLPFQEHSPNSIRAPISSFLGGFQYAVPPGTRYNSFLNLLIYQDTKNYSIEALDRRKRQQVRSASREFTIRPIGDATEFIRKAYPVYLSFYDRTKYDYKSKRRNRDYFSRWADTLFQFPKVAILGAYRNGELGAVSISELVEDTLIYSTAFSNDDSFRRHVTSLMLHCLQQAAADFPDVNNIFAGQYKYQGRIGVDKFHLDRGCTLVNKPSVVCLNPLAKVCLRHFLGREYRRLFGRIEPAQSCPPGPQPAGTESYF